MRIAASLLVFLVCAIPASSQPSGKLLNGSWQVKGMETAFSLIDFEDTTFSINNMLAQYRLQNNIQKIPVQDSLNMLQRFREIIPEFDQMRFNVTFKADNTYTWKGSINDPNAVMKGTFQYKPAANEIILSGIDENKEKQNLKIKVISLAPDKLVIQIPSNNFTMNESKWILKRL